MCFLLPVVACTSEAVSETSEVGDVRIVIENKASEPMRCVAIIAHFLTREIGKINSGGKVAVGYTLHEDGSLSQGHYKGKNVYVESVRCGSDSDWTNTAADIPLDMLRSKTVKAMKAVCTVKARLSCLLEETPR
ncbi:MAG: hypothetical protein RIM72_02650 [Alphaproteobacteria bacterium]